MRNVSLACLVVMAACAQGADDGAVDGADPLARIHAELEPLQGFSFDSGWLPASSPVQLQLKASAGGKLIMDADAAADVGTMSLDAGIELAATIKSTITGAAYEGPVQGAPALSIKLVGSTAFEPMTVGKPATLSVAVQPTDLMTIPLATALGIPAATGDLTLQLAGGTVTAQLTGTCADDGHFTAALQFSGTVTLGGRFKVAVPLVGEKTFELPTISMQLPSAQTMINFSTPDDPEAKGCTPVAGGSGSTGNGGSGSGSGGAGGPAGVWDIIVHSVVFGARPDGTAWDGGSAADPYVIVKINGREYATQPQIDKEGSAAWGAIVGTVTTVDLVQGLSIEILDRDWSTAEHMGGPASDPAHPADDYIASVSTVAFTDGLVHTIDMSWGGVAASIRLELGPR
jgi:hypothetical protein